MACQRSLGILLFLALAFTLKGQPQAHFSVRVDRPGAPIQPTQWGVFFEDINLGADGGLYAELVKNRSFEFSKPLMGWTLRGPKLKEGDVLLLNSAAQSPGNPHYIRLRADHAARGDLGLTNEGFRGMGIKKGMRYDFSVMVRQRDDGIKIFVGLTDSAGNPIGGASLDPHRTGEAWQKVSVSFTATATVTKAKMDVWLEGSGTIDLDMISLFPADTWKKRPGGMRADMVQLLADLHPGFIRFPGGCIVEGFDLANRYQWKKTIGPVADRQLIINRWNLEFAHRPAPDYFQTFGLGFFEYFQLAEDIGAEPLPILNCGMACQFNTAELAPMEELGPYIRDALDLIEFANGDSSTEWGRVRSAMGHPAPFHLKMMGVGNENWGPQYVARLQAFTKAIKEKYPDFKLVNSSGTDPGGERFDYLDHALREMKVDIIDEHYYRKPEWFLANARRYDHYSRTGPKIFAGEYAAQSDRTGSPANKNTWLCALSEAAFMTGLERNADVVCMASYAPLFAHADGWQWTPDLIWVNNLDAYGTPDYYVQQAFSRNRGTRLLPITLDGEVAAGRDSLYATAAIDSATGEVIVKVVNASGRNVRHTMAFPGSKKLGASASLTTLSSEDPGVVNSFALPRKISPVNSSLRLAQGKISGILSPYSLNIIRIKQLNP